MKSGYRLRQDNETMNSDSDHYRILPNGEWYTVRGLSGFTVGEWKKNLLSPELFQCRCLIKKEENNEP